MRRSTGFTIVLAAFGVAPAAQSLQAQTPAEFAQTAAFAAAHQNKDGGFAAKPDQASSLASTNSALKILKHVGGSVPDVLTCVKYVKSCSVAGGGFAPTPGGKPDVVTTALGLMAASDLKILDHAMIRKAVAYLGRNARTFEEVRMSIAGLEAAGVSSPDIPRWNQQIQTMRNPDGTFGNGAAQAFATGGAAAAILRMGLRLDKRDAVLAAIHAGQRPEGGWSKDDGPPDLSSSYRITRALFMLREKPDIERLAGFIARCRHSDGSYSTTPGGTGDLGGTYLGTILTYWIRQLSGLPAVVETAGFAPLVNGDDLRGWEGDTRLWSVQNGMLVGRSSGLDHNEFLATTRPYGDFILSLNFRMVDGKGNSGVQFRSVRVPPPSHEMSGYQADLGEGYWGALYDESRRNMVLVYPRSDALRTLNRTDWNHYVIRAIGDRITLNINGQDTVRDYQETDPTIARTGSVAVQMHAGSPMEIQFKDLLIQPLPTPTAENPTAPGFHLRTVQTDQGERKYTVYVPDGYDGTKTVPVILFLHGAGERGQDGITPAQVGIGPAILNRSGGIPALVVFPQARQTWAAGLPDSQAALRALDDVMSAYKTDPKRVVLTGLSMGGHGSWDNAIAQPDRFAAVVPICGPGSLDGVTRLKTLPVWTFCGDADRDATVLNLRAMVLALKGEGATARLTEYRGVGHNSWDRAYNDHELIDWMLAQRRP
jgi:pimeloyl-ACP methyl ester carboxylesterase/prenyltransferase beta subunit